MNHFILPGLKEEAAIHVKNVKIRKMLKSVTAVTGITYEQMKERTRVKPIVLARMVAIYMIRTNTSLTTMQIGLWFNLHHASILHAVHKVQNPYDKELRRIYAKCNEHYFDSIIEPLGMGN
jgi:chromosomal replication initiation ATPase DnaA